MGWQQDIQMANESARVVGDAILLMMGVEDPVLLVADIVFELFALIGGGGNPFDALFSSLSGRPKMEATYDEAKAFMARRSPALRMLGVGASKALHAGIPLSSPEVGPIFGPYYQAALVIENALRWGSQNQSVTNVDNATLTAAMHEAGNPGEAGTATMDAMDRAWEVAGEDVNKVNSLRALQIWTGAGLAADLIRAFGQQYNTKFNPGPVGTPTGQPTLPPPPVIPAPQPTPPPPPPSMPAPLVTGQIFIDLPFDAGLHGDHEFTTQVQGGPFPTAHLDIKLDGQEIQRLPAGTHDGHTPIHVTTTLHTQQYKDGPHRLHIQWTGERGLVHAEITTLIQFANHGSEAPPPPPKPPLPPPPAIPWEDWFKVCAEVPNCEHLSDEGLAVVQSISNVAFVLNHLFQAQSNVQEDPCCQQLIAILTQVNNSVAALGHFMPTPLNLTPIVEQLKCICDQITNVAVDIKVEKPDLDALIAELHQDNHLLLEELEKTRETLIPDPAEVKRASDELQAQRSQLLAFWRDRLGFDSGLIQLLHA
ncbi:MAG TPA: hypothetical protein VKH81_03855 [Candidatus Angelobacter sp.]|nr:hypothetical protein [Candidatus Angelobacter sp.]